ncbi:hypothetical protein D557_0262 [Bordetella holmesii 70147]|nr:hypothetical protein D557_0262 [Bordetella holmesii 70147]KAK69839.1 hypothetical protein L573_2467 [Bordetella holmesii H620]
MGRVGRAARQRGKPGILTGLGAGGGPAAFCRPPARSRQGTGLARIAAARPQAFAVHLAAYRARYRSRF